jgi:hypothetical protein
LLKIKNKSEPQLKKKSAVGFLAVGDGGDFDGTVSFQIEEDPGNRRNGDESR